MDAERYYGLLLRLRDEGIRFHPFMGRRWFIVKGFALAVSLVIVWSGDPIIRGAGLVLLGFAAGVIAMDVRTYFTTKRYWPYQKQVLNWDKIETLSKEAV